MLKLFSNQESIRSGVSIDPAFEYIQRSYARELLKIKDYFRNNEIYVTNQHILSRIIKVCSVSHERDLFDYMSAITDRAPYVANNFKLTSLKNKGQVHESEFYGENSLEIIISVDTLEDIEEASSYWRELKPVNVIRHGNKDVDMMIPGEWYRYAIPTLSCFTIDIPMLMLQYRSWSLDKITKGIDNFSPSLFVSQYVLPNMLDSQLDYSVMNILMDIENPIPTVRETKHYPFKVLDYRTRLYKLLNSVYGGLSKKKIRYEDVLKNIPAFSTKNMYGGLYLPTPFLNRQNRWAVLLSRINVVYYLLTNFTRAIRTNRTTIKDFMMNYNMLKRDNILEDMLDDFSYDFVSVTIDEIIDF